MKHCIINLGCKVNRVESDQMDRIFKRAKSVETGLEDADIVVINTCAVTSEAEKKTRKATRHAVKTTHANLILATGCAAYLAEDFFTNLDSRIRVVAKSEIESEIKQLLRSRNEEIIEQQSHMFQTPLTDHNGDDLNGENLIRNDSNNGANDFGFKSKARMGVKVQDGCDNNCSYCVVRIARGPSYSLDFKSIETEVLSLIQAGTREIVLTGINLGKYNEPSFSQGEHDLAWLINELLESTKDEIFPEGMPCRFRISSIEPKDINNDLLEVMAQSCGRVCKHLHIPLQSGSQSILHQMRRNYEPSEFLDIVKNARSYMKDLSITTDVIVGFPEETDEDFKDTLSVCRQSRFSKIHVFPFSARMGTDAYAMDNQIAPHIKSLRAKELRCLSDELRALDFQNRVGTQEVCVSEGNGIACTESYHRVCIDKNIPEGCFLRIELNDKAGDTIQP